MPNLKPDCLALPGNIVKPILMALCSIKFRLSRIYRYFTSFYFFMSCEYLAALLLKLEKRIAEVPINSKELGFTKPGPYIYELLADLNITQETASKLIDIIDEAAELLEEDKLQKRKSSACRIESIGNILKIIFRDKGTAHAEYYRVSFKPITCIHSICNL